MTNRTPNEPDWQGSIRFVARFAPIAAYGVAPERRDQLEEAAEGVQLVLKESNRWQCRYQPNKDRGQIIVSSRVFEVLWASSYAYLEIYRRVFEGRREETPVVITLHETSELADSSRLLQWAMETVLNKNNDDYPTDLPSPTKHPRVGSALFLADEICLVAFAFLFHHELAHHTLKHEPSKPGLDSIAQEKDADNTAVDWLLGMLDEDDIRFQKRSLGVAAALSTLVGFSVHSPWPPGGGHPRSFDRLEHALSRYIDNPDHPTWGFVVAVLKLHLDNSRYSTPSCQKFQTFRDAVRSYCNCLAESESATI